MQLEPILEVSIFVSFMLMLFGEPGKMGWWWPPWRPRPKPTPIPPTPTPTPTPTPDPSPSSDLEELLKSHNSHRTVPLSLNDKLTAAAQGHAKEMADSRSMFHGNFSGRIDAQGYKWNDLGENVAEGYPDVASVMAGWMGDEPHRANIEHENFTDVGFGIAKDSSGVTYWCADFGHPA